MKLINSPPPPPPPSQTPEDTTPLGLQSGRFNNSHESICREISWKQSQNMRISDLGLFSLPPPPLLRAFTPIHLPLPFARRSHSADGAFQRRADTLASSLFLSLSVYPLFFGVAKTQRLCRKFSEYGSVRFNHPLLSTTPWANGYLSLLRWKGEHNKCSKRQMKSSKMCSASRGLSGMFIHCCINQKHIVKSNRTLSFLIRPIVS